MKQQTVFKVVRKVCPIIDEIKGAFVSARNTNYALSYNIGGTTTPIIGKIFCFHSLENARKFAQESEVILSGIGTNPTKIKRACAMQNCISTFWGAIKNKHKPFLDPILYINAPEGTVTVDSFTPEKIVKIIQQYENR